MYIAIAILTILTTGRLLYLVWLTNKEIALVLAISTGIVAIACWWNQQRKAFSSR